MRFLANENFPGDAVAELVTGGHDVVWVRTAAPGTKDADVLAWAVREERVLLTFDKDFCELAWLVGCQHRAASYFSGCQCHLHLR
jgi:predicted nuclease of predicted toxin-antitoxin system